LGWNLFETLKLYYATVVDIEDPDEKGKIQIQILPELESVKESSLPWAMPWFNRGMSADEYSFSVPPVDSKIWVLVDDYWTEFYYLTGTFIEGYFDYSSVKSEIDNIDEVSETTYPNINFMLFENGNILFQNISNGDTGFLHKSGNYYVINSDGEMYGYAGEQKIQLYNDKITVLLDSDGLCNIENDGITFSLKNDGTYSIEGNGTIECDSTGAIKVNGSNLEVLA
jgi:hypothetical protein